MADNIIGFRRNGAPIFALRGADGVFEFLVEDDDDDRSGPTSNRGSRVADDDDDDRDDDDDGDDGEGGAAGGDDWKPPTREQWERLQRSASTAKSQAAQRRKLLREHGINPRTGKPSTGAASGATGGDSDDQGSLFGDQGGLTERELARAAARASQETEDAYRPVVIRAGVKSALAEAGWNGSGAKLITRMIDLEDIELDIDDQGNPVFEGLEDQIDAIREEFPQWFDDRERGGRTAGRRRAVSSATVTGAGAVDGGRGSRGGGRVAPKGWRQALDARIAGTARRSR